MESNIEFDIWLNDIFLKNNIDPVLKNNFIFLRFSEYDSEKNNSFYIYEDWWLKNSKIIKSKILSSLNLNMRIYARNCIVKRINKTVADKFLNKYHIYGTANSKVKLGLFNGEELFGIATFAAQRQFKAGRSAELVRYCSKSKYTIVGGIDKLLKAYEREYKPDSIMTYIDLDWGSGIAFKKLGFAEAGIKPKMTFFVDTITNQRIPEKYFKKNTQDSKYIKVQNRGSLKMIKEIMKF